MRFSVPYGTLKTLQTSQYFKIMKGSETVDIASRLAMSYYKEIATLNSEHIITLVQNVQTKHVFVRKTMNIYNRFVYEYLQNNPCPNIPHIYEIYEADGSLTIIEEYISGNTLDELLNSGFVFSEQDIRNIMIKLCDILLTLHNCNPPIIHRDIKPSNIIIRPDGEVFLIDLNAAKYQSAKKAEDTSLIGTKGYAAPEQYGFGTSNNQTDIYALGMLANTLASGGFSPIINENSVFFPIIKKCTQLKPADRYSDVREIKQHLGASFNYNYKYDWQKFLPPGFRSLNPLYIILSSAVYVFIFCVCSTLEVKNSNRITLAIDRIFCLMIFLAIIFCTFNYCNVQRFFPPCRTSNKVLKFLSVILLDFTVASILLAITTFLSIIFSLS